MRKYEATYDQYGEEVTYTEIHTCPKRDFPIKMNWFNPDEAMKTGTFTCGSSGSGKTVLNFHFADMLMEKGVIVYVLDPSQAWQKGSSVPNVRRVGYPSKVTFPNGNSLDGKTLVKNGTIFDISFLTYPQRVDFTETICKWILDDRKKLAKPPPTFVFFEECQLVFYQGSMRSLKRHSNAVELVTNGRNFKVRYGAITQFASMVDKLLLKVTRQRYLGYTSEPNDVEYLEDIIGKEMAKELPILEVGEFLYSYPRREHKHTQRIKVPMFHRESPNIKIFRQNG
ncbi:MAG: hypothetical protein OEZ35_00025 [Candidatus Bathyarchaeota archaeon]|nr:hypothetical protein [Candidatus Bathyarchaeota archaeon]